MRFHLGRLGKQMAEVLVPLKINRTPKTWQFRLSVQQPPDSDQSAEAALWRYGCMRLVLLASERQSHQDLCAV